MSSPAMPMISDSEFFERKLVVLNKLSDAIRDYLCFDTVDILKQIKEREINPPFDCNPPLEEDLVNAREQVTMWEDALEKITIGIQQTNNEEFKLILENTQLPLIKEQLARSTRNLQHIQSHLENKNNG